MSLDTVWVVDTVRMADSEFWLTFVQQSGGWPAASVIATFIIALIAFLISLVRS